MKENKVKLPTLAEVSEAIDWIYEEGQKVFDTYKLCQNDETGEPCIHGDFCCSGCQYLTSKGCRVKAVWCKLWTCAAVMRKVKANPKLQPGLERLRDLNAYLIRTVPGYQYGRYCKATLIKQAKKAIERRNQDGKRYISDFKFYC